MPDEPARVHLSLNGNAVKAPITAVFRDVLDYVAFGLNASERVKGDNLGTLPSGLIGFGFAPPGAKRDAEALRAEFRSWLLTRAFGELIKAVGTALERAYEYCEVLSLVGRESITTGARLTENLERIHRTAEKAGFSELQRLVADRLTGPLELGAHISTMNDVRNCLEHRHGIVGSRDTRNGDHLVLRWRRLQLAYVGDDDQEEVEIHGGPQVLGRPGSSGQIIQRIVECQREYALGARIDVSLEEFNQSMFTCWLYGEDLAAKLPRS